MRNVWVAALLVLSLGTGGWILVQDRVGAGESAFAAVADEAGAALAGVQERAAPAAGPSDREPATFYRYTDESGSIRFVTSLADVPKHLRDRAQPVAEGRVQRAPAAAPRARAAERAGRAERPAPRERALARNRDVVVYTTSWCGWCRKTLAFLDEHGVDYENRDIEADDAWRDELEQKTGSTSIPVVEIEGELVRGYDPARMRQLLEAS